MAHRRTSTQAGSRSGELSGIGRVGWPVEEFGSGCGELAGPKETASRQQGKCYRNPVLHRAEPLEGCCTQGVRASCMGRPNGPNRGLTIGSKTHQLLDGANWREFTYTLWIICSDGHARVLCARESKYLVHPAVRLRIRARLALRFPSRRLAVRTR